MLTLRTFLTTLCLTLGVLATPVLAQSPMVFVTQGAAISGYDPVAYFTVGRAVRGKPQYAVVWKRAEWHFVSPENRAAFEANPRAYAPQYGGYCAYGVAQGGLSTSEPQSWTIHEGRLFLIHNANVHQIWRADVIRNVLRADANWPSVLRD